MTRVLLAGATGAIGGEIVRLLRERGDWVRTLSRDAGRAGALRSRADEVLLRDATVDVSGAAEGVEVVVSALGANVGLHLRERKSYGAIDVVANAKLLAEARRAGARRFVYVGVHAAPGFERTRYVVAHERFTGELLEAPGLTGVVVRPTGVFTALAPLLDMARRPVMPLVGDGCARTNPVHPSCVAEACVRAIDGGERDVSVGGPEILTRRQIAELAFAARGRRPRFVRVPPAMFRAGSLLLRTLHPRLSELLEFAAAVSTHEALAPAVGTRRLEDYFRTLAGR